VPNGKERQANNDSSEANILGKELFHENESVRLALASSSNTPGEILAALSKDTSDSVKLAVACNSQTPHHIVARLANHGSRVVKAGLAADINTPLEILNVLAEDNDEEVRMTARQSRRVAGALLAEKPTGKVERPFGPLSPRWA
jgi:hypothetical protein